MSYTPNNVPVYLAAYNAIAGFYDAQFQHPVDYAELADAWAQALDTAWSSATYTGLELDLIGSCSVVQWEGQPPAPDGHRYDPTAYADAAADVIALVKAGNAQVVAEGIDPNGGGGGAVLAGDVTGPLHANLVAKVTAAATVAVTDTGTPVPTNLPFPAVPCSWLSSVNHQVNPPGLIDGTYDTALRIDMSGTGGGFWDSGSTESGSSTTWFSFIAGNRGTHELIDGYIRGTGVGDCIPMSMGADAYGGITPAFGALSVPAPLASPTGEFDFAQGGVRYSSFAGPVPTETSNNSIFQASVTGGPAHGATVIALSAPTNLQALGCRYILNKNHITTAGVVTAISVDDVNKESTITFSGTAWTAADVGRYLKIGSSQDLYPVANVAALLGDDIYLNGFGVGHWYRIKSVASGTSLKLEGVWDEVGFATSFALLPTAPYMAIDGSEIQSFSPSGTSITIQANAYTWSNGDALYSPPHHYMGPVGMHLIMAKLFKDTPFSINMNDGVRIDSEGYSPIYYGLRLSGVSTTYGGFNTGIRMEGFTGAYGLDMRGANLTVGVAMAQGAQIVMDASASAPYLQGESVSGIKLVGQTGQYSLFATDGVNSDFIVSHPSAGTVKFIDSSLDTWLIQASGSFVSIGPGGGTAFEVTASSIALAVPQIVWAGTVTAPNITQTSEASVIKGQDILISPQKSTHVTDNGGGNLTVDLQAPSGAGVEAALKLTRSGTFEAQIEYYGGNYTGLWLGLGSTPGAGNFALIATGGAAGTTILNAASGGTIYITTGGSATTGVVVTGTQFYGATDNNVSLGLVNARWTALFVATMEITSAGIGGISANSGVMQLQATVGALSTAANIALSAAQAATPVIQLNNTVGAGGITVTLPNIVGGIWYFDITGVTFGANGITFTTGSGTSAVVSGTHGAAFQTSGKNLLTVVVVASNFVSVG